MFNPLRPKADVLIIVLKVKSVVYVFILLLDALCEVLGACRVIRLCQISPLDTVYVHPSFYSDDMSASKSINHVVLSDGGFAPGPNTPSSGEQGFRLICTFEVAL